MEELPLFPRETQSIKVALSIFHNAPASDICDLTEEARGDPDSSVLSQKGRLSSKRLSYREALSRIQQAILFNPQIA
jgi:hypothetical protein